MNDKPLILRVAKGGSIILLFTFLVSPIAYLTRLFYSHTLSVEMYGLFYSVISLFLLLATYNDLGFGYSVSYLVPKFIKSKNFTQAWNVYKYEQFIEVATSILISLVLVLLSNWLANNYFKSPLASNLIHILTIYFIANSFIEALNKLFIGLQQEIFYSSIQFCKQLFTLLFSLIFWFINYQDVIYFALSWAAAYIFVAFIYSFFLKRNNPDLVGKITWDKPLFLQMYHYAIPTLMTTSLYSFIVYSDTIFLTFFKGVREVGIYNVVVPLASISALFLSPLNRLILPLTSHLMEGEQKRINSLMDIILRLVPFIALYFALFLTMFPTSTTILLFGDKWKYLVENSLGLLALGYIALSIANYLASVVSGAGKVKQIMYSSIILALISLILSLLLIPKLGVLGAVITNTTVYLASVIVYSIILKTITNLKFPFGFYLKLLLFSVFSFCLIRFLRFSPSGWIEFIITGGIYTLIYFFLGLLLGVYKIILYE